MSDSTAIEKESVSVEVVGRFATRIGRRWRGDRDLIELIDDELWEIEGELDHAGETARAAFLGIPELIRRDVGHLPLFEIAEVAQAAVHALGGSWKGSIPEDVEYVLVGLATRAISTLREIAILLEHGYAFGARARWRTLSEILVVARVLVQGDRYTATRYKEHRWIILAEQRRRSGMSAWGGGSPTPEVIVRRLRRRFGDEYGGLYGWAAKVTKRKLGKEKPGWADLVALAKIEEHSSRILEAHHAVHGADSLGMIGTVDLGRGMFHPGGSPQHVLEVSRSSARLFRQTMWDVFDIGIRYTQARKPLILQGIVEAHAFNLEVDLGWRVLSTDPDAREQYFAATSEFWNFPDLFSAEEAV